MMRDQTSFKEPITSVEGLIRELFKNKPKKCGRMIFENWKTIEFEGNFELLKDYETKEEYLEHERKRIESLLWFKAELPLKLISTPDTFFDRDKAVRYANLKSKVPPIIIEIRAALDIDRKMRLILNLTDGLHRARAQKALGQPHIEAQFGIEEELYLALKRFL